MDFVHPLRQFALALLTTTVFILCDALSARWGKHGGSAHLVALFALAPLGFILFGVMNRSQSLAATSGLVNSSIAVGTILVGLLVFHDQLTVQQGIGIVLAVVAVGLLSF